MSVLRTVHFSGQVQGVGFRFTVRRIAEAHDVSGSVRNLPDGRVELIAEGDAEELDRFVDAIRQAMGAYIADLTTAEAPAEGRFADFRIAY